MPQLILVIDILIQLYIFIIFIYVLLSYFPELRNTRLYQTLEAICEPLLKVFRFATIQGISFAPILATLFLIIINNLIHFIYG